MVTGEKKEKPEVEEPAMAVVIEEEEDDEHDSKESVLLKYFLREWKLVKSLLDDIVSNGRVSDLSSVYKIRSIIDKYQQQGQLLEPYLESIVSPLMFIVRSKAAELEITSSSEILEVIKPLCIVIYTLVTVCGYKAVIKFFPHQVCDLELAVSLLEKCHNVQVVTSLRQESTGEMETKCVILLWLSILILIPFDMSSVDSSIVGDSQLFKDEPPPMVQKIIGFCKDYLSSAGPMRTIAAMLLSKLLTRPDMLKAFISFVQWTHEVLSSTGENVIVLFRLLGVVEALAAIFKTGSVEVLHNVVSTVWNDTALLIKSNTTARSSLLRKCLIKLSQRIGLSCLPHRSLSWHYLGRNTDLGESILQNVSRTFDQSKYYVNVEEANQNQEDMDVPETVEEIIDVLLSGLKDTDTIVRWSSAKGIGRVTSRLTLSLSDEVLSSILDLFSPGEGDGSWHGGCLALAELARRGLLLPSSLPKVTPVIVKALHYDIRRGPHSIGSHVRDAAAYVCWAFGRAYYHADMKSVLEQLAPHLLTVACYDREVNCRRAAAAAFQENVGRQGSFPHGIDIVNTADYFALSSRMNSYLHVAVNIAQYEGYLFSFVDELLHNKISHWDKNLRELAANALSVLVKYEPEYFTNFVLEKLIPCTLSSDLCMRHGATLAVGEVVLALHQCHYSLSTDKQNHVAGIVPGIEKARLYRGKGGEVMRSAVSRLIECISVVQIHLPAKIKKSLLDTLNENLRHPNSLIQNVAVDALKHFVPSYLMAAETKGKNDIVSKYVEQLTDPNVAARRGSALALGVLPFDFLSKGWQGVLSKLCCSCIVEDNPDDRDAEARVNSVRGLVSVCETLTKMRENSDIIFADDELSFFRFIKNEVMQTLLTALEDYSVDNRGDVGSWVREAAMDGLERCTYILCKRDFMGFSSETQVKNSILEPNEEEVIENNISSFFDANLATSLVGGILKQAVEKIDKIREFAARVLQRILYNKTMFIPFIPHRDELEQIIPNDADLKWAIPFFSYPCFVRTLQLSHYSKFVISGLVVSVGGLQDSLRKASLAALLDYLQSTGTTCQSEICSREFSLSRDILWVLFKYRKCDRVITPTLKTIEILFSKKVFLDMEAQTPIFYSGVLDSLSVELKSSKDFSKLYAGIAILGYIASVHDSINILSFSLLLTFLGHRFPKIRKASAEQIYLVLLQNGDLIPEDKLEKALELISETSWEGNVEEARQHRLELCKMANVETGLLLKNSHGMSDKVGEKQPRIVDENASYSSLVESAGF